MIADILQDAFFAAIAAIGFASISNPPRNTYLYCAIIAAIGHSLRFVLMQSMLGLHIVAATGIAAFAVGLAAVLVSPRARIPAETFLFPSLLPMIPGMYAYRTFQNLLGCVSTSCRDEFLDYFYRMSDNFLTGCLIIIMLAAGAVVPMLAFSRTSFQATRHILRY